MADGDENAVGGQHAALAGFDIRHFRARHAQRIAVAQHFIDNCVPDHFDLGIFEQAFLHDLFRTENVLAVDDSDLGGKVREEQRFFDSRVATADEEHFLAAIEEPVACRASRNAEALKMLLRRQAQPFGLCACRHDHGIRRVNRAAVAGEAEGAL